MTETINKTTQFNQQLAVTSDNGNTENYAGFNGSIDQYGVPSVNYYINNSVAYHENLATFRENWSKFQEVVFAEADKVTDAIKSADQATTDGH